MTAKQIRQAYLKFFEEREHELVPRASLVPQDDPTTLFTGSGMQPMVPYLLGEEYPGGHKRIANSQVVFRAVDIDDIGDSEHLTSFEMLGNWSLGDYFKAAQIPQVAEFYFDVLKLDPAKVYVTCYIGNSKFGIPKDEEAIALWQAEFKKRGIEAKVVEIGTKEQGDKLGMQGGRILLYAGRENWWSRGGNEEGTPIGDPCGPDSEIFYLFGEEFHDEEKYGKLHPASDSGAISEIGNSVFMSYRRDSEDKFIKLKKPNVDFGGGMERLAMACLGKPDIYATDIAKPFIDQLEVITGKEYGDQTKAFRVITDHVKSACWLAVDGVVPSNTGQGYVLRRLVRRAVRFGLDLGINERMMAQLVPIYKSIYTDDYPEVEDNYDSTLRVLENEERVFRQTLQKGLRELEKMATKNEGKLGGSEIFKLQDTYGFPMEVSVEESGLRGFKLSDDWKDVFEREIKEQKERSRTANTGQFKGGLADQSDISVKYHTATHLMYRALRNVLGDHVIQKGSNITPERLRFDFTHHEKVTPEQIKQIEDMVNEQIEKDWPVSWKEENTNEALESGVLGAFGDRYGENVKVYTVGDPKGDHFSQEICGGPHVEHTGLLAEEGRRFKIKKEESSSAGVRRIKAVLI